MFKKSLPITIAPIAGECLTSFLMRTAAVYGVSAEQLIRHCLPEARVKKQVSASVLTVQPDDAILAELAGLLRIPVCELQAMTLPAHISNLGCVAFSGAAKDPSTGEETPSRQLRFSWCPLCLMEDRAGGCDHYLRHDWSLAYVTMCPEHKRPLIERCQECYNFVEQPEYARYGEQMALICPRCFTPLDARLGYDFVANQHAHEWNDDATVHQVWERLLSYERFILKAIRQRAGRSKKRRLVTDMHGMFDFLLSAESPNYLRPIDMFDSAYFPSPTKLGFASRHLMQPFNVCHLVERRKAMALVIGMLENSVDTFGFRSGTTPTRQIRELMNRDTYNRFERHILNIARQALPI